MSVTLHGARGKKEEVSNKADQKTETRQTQHKIVLLKTEIMASEQSMTQTITQAGTEVIEATIMAVRVAENLVDNARPHKQLKELAFKL